MKPLFLTLLCYLTAIAACGPAQSFPVPIEDMPGWARPNQNSVVGELRQNIPAWLVQAQAIQLVPDKTYDGKFNIVTWKITHVYAGIAEIEATTFETSSARDSHGIKVLNPKLNELAIYCVRPRLDDSSPAVDDDRAMGKSFYGYRFPVQQSDPTFPQALAYAQSIERVAKADRNEQIRLLGSYAKSEMPQRSAWAISTLAQSGLESAPKFLLGLLNEPKLPLAGVLALDEGLQALDENGKAQWSRTSTRFDLWRHLVTAPASEDDGVAIVSRLSELGQEESQKMRSAQINKTTYTLDIGGARLFEWLRLAADNAKWAPNARSYAMGSVGELAQMGRTNLIGRDAAFAYLLRQLKAVPELGPNGKAAKLSASELYKVQGPLFGLRYLRPFSAAEAAPLRALQKRARSPFAKELFGQLFEKNP